MVFGSLMSDCLLSKKLFVIHYSPIIDALRGTSFKERSRLWNEMVLDT